MDGWGVRGITWNSTTQSLQARRQEFPEGGVVDSHCESRTSWSEVTGAIVVEALGCLVQNPAI